MPRFLPAVATAALGLAALPALAQPANMRPTRDVTVNYRLSGLSGTSTQEMLMTFAPSVNKQRVDPAGAPGWMLIDRGANTAVMVMDAQRMTMAMPPATVAAMTQDPPAGATFTRKGTATVAGTACTEWDVAIGGSKATSCYTDDGVLLRNVATTPDNTTVTMEATQVTYGPIDPARLTVPQGYHAVQVPASPPGAPPAR